MGKTNGFFGEFKNFISRGNVMDMAVGVIIGGAFSGIVNSLVSDVIMPVVSKFLGGMDFSNWFIPLDGNKYLTLAQAQEAGAATLNYGSFLTVVINFVLLAFIIFLMVKSLNTFSDKNKQKQPQQPAAPTTKTCPYCKTEIAIDAVRCPNCTSQLQ